MERSFGRSFTDILVYRGPEARAAANALGARAYVLGNQIAFADDAPSKEVVAHELTHVVQQNGGSKVVRAKSEVSRPEDAHEKEADRIGNLVASGQPSGAVSQPATSAVSRLDVWDLLNVGTGGAAAERELTKNSPARQTLDDLIGSMVAGVKFMPEEFKALFPDKEDIAGWWRFIQITEGLVGAEIGVLILTGVPDPTFATKLAAVVLQALIVTFMVVMSVQLGSDAVKTAQKWWDNVSSAHGDPAKIQAAAQNFAHLVADLIQLIGTLADIVRASGTLGKLHGTETQPHAKPPVGVVEEGVPLDKSNKAIDSAQAHNARPKGTGADTHAKTVGEGSAQNTGPQHLNEPKPTTTSDDQIARSTTTPVDITSEAGKRIGVYAHGSRLEIISKDVRLHGGNTIKLDPEATTTVTGTLDDTNAVARRGERLPGATKTGENAGGVNILRSPRWSEIQTKHKAMMEAGDVTGFWKTVTDEFWETVNKPWLDDAIARGDNFRLISNPGDETAMFVTAGKDKHFVLDGGEKVRSIFGREVDYLKSKGYAVEPDGTAIKVK